eukprot:3474087-Pyramimonas_sp.AAC.1
MSNAAFDGQKIPPCRQLAALRRSFCESLLSYPGPRECAALVLSSHVVLHLLTLWPCVPYGCERSSPVLSSPGGG